MDDHLRDVLKQHYYITEDWAGTKFAGIDIEWNYAPKHVDPTFHLCIREYIKDLLLRFGNKPTSKPQLSSHKHREIIYGAKTQMTHKEDTSPPLYEAGIKQIQSIVGAVLFYGRAIHKKLLVTLNYIGTNQAEATEATDEAVNQILDYLTTYSNDGIVYLVSDMIIAAHSASGFHNESKVRSRTGAHILYLKMTPSHVGMYPSLPFTKLSSLS